MSLKAKRTSWNHKLRPIVRELMKQLGLKEDASFKILHGSLAHHAMHFYKLGRAAGIAEGRRRQKDEPTR